MSDAESLEPNNGASSMSVNGYQLNRLVGTDAYGDVFVAEGDEGNCVITILRDSLVLDTFAANRFESELAVLDALDLSAVIPTLSFDFTVRPRWISSAVVAGQLLSQRVASGGPLQPDSVRLLAVQLALTLRTLHNGGILQRDLSSDSVLLTSEGAKVWRTGWAGLVDGSAYSTTSHTQAIEWLAPEQVLGDPTSSASDIHAWAVTVLFAATGANPFAADKSSAAVARLMSEVPILPALFDPVLASLLAGALQKDPSSRPTARDLVAYLDPSAAPLPAPMVGQPVAAELADIDPDEARDGREFAESPAAFLRKEPVDADPADDGEYELAEDEDFESSDELQDPSSTENWDSTYYDPESDHTARVGLGRVAVMASGVAAVGVGLGVLIGKIVSGG